MNTCCDIAALRTAYDEKSLFPAYIREFEQKMKQYHTQALSNAQVGNMVGCYVYLTTHSDIPIRHRGMQFVRFYKWPIVQNTGAPTTHDKPGSLTCPVYSTDTWEHFSRKEPVHISFL